MKTQFVLALLLLVNSIFLIREISSSRHKLKVSEDDLKIITEYSFYTGYYAAMKNLNRDSILESIHLKDSRLFK